MSFHVEGREHSSCLVRARRLTRLTTQPNSHFFCTRDRDSYGITSSSEESAILAHTSSLLQFHLRHRFCGKCGSATLPQEGGGHRKCGGVCSLPVFPRTDPVVIFLVIDPASDKCLLGRQKVWPKGKWSTLAGFMEHGEVRAQLLTDPSLRWQFPPPPFLGASLLSCG